MILPTKHIRADRALLSVGAELLGLLRHPMTVSRLWDRFRERRGNLSGVAPVTYDWFVLTLDLLFIMGAVGLEDGLLRKAKP